MIPQAIKERLKVKPVAIAEKPIIIKIDHNLETNRENRENREKKKQNDTDDEINDTKDADATKDKNKKSSPAQAQHQKIVFAENADKGDRAIRFLDQFRKQQFKYTDTAITATSAHAQEEQEKEKQKGKEKDVTSRAIPVATKRKREDAADGAEDDTPRIEAEEEEEKQMNFTFPGQQLDAVPLPKRGRTDVGEYDDIIISGVPISVRIPKPIQLYTRIPQFYMNNREMFTSFINKLYEPYKQQLLQEGKGITCENIGKDTDVSLLMHQRIVLDYMNADSPFRGLLVFHGLGSGKTCTSIAIAESMTSTRQIIIMTPASLRRNYMDEIKKCGDLLYRRNQYWEWISTETKPALIPVLSNILGLPEAYIKRRRGAWFVNIKKKNNYSELQTAQKVSLDAQLDAMIENKFLFINYNNSRLHSKFRALTNNYTKNIFDNACVIIDEAHNLISRIVNKINKSANYAKDRKEKFPHLIALQLYEFLMRAENAKIVLLSGTPIINYPNEIGILFNILRGYIKSWSFSLNVDNVQDKRISLDILMDIFKRDKRIDYIDYKPSSKTLVVTRNPFGFENVYARGTGPGATGTNEYRGVRRSAVLRGGGSSKGSSKDAESRDDDDNEKQKDNSKEEKDDKEDKKGEGKVRATNDYMYATDEVFVRQIVALLKKEGITANQRGAKVTYNTALPDTLDEFMALFINGSNGEVINIEKFKRRILGLTSYFRSAQEELLPHYDKTMDYHVVRIPMSDYQFKLYEDARKEERKTEKPKKNKALIDGDMAESSSTYRIFSRLFCNFAMPVPPGRPRPLSHLKVGVEAGENDEANTVQVQQNTNVAAAASVVREGAKERDVDVDIDGEKEKKENHNKTKKNRPKVTATVIFDDTDDEVEADAEYVSKDGRAFEGKRAIAERAAEDVIQLRPKTKSKVVAASLKAAAKAAADSDKADAKAAKEVANADAKMAKKVKAKAAVDRGTIVGTSVKGGNGDADADIDTDNDDAENMPIDEENNTDNLNAPTDMDGGAPARKGKIVATVIEDSDDDNDDNAVQQQKQLGRDRDTEGEGTASVYVDDAKLREEDELEGDEILEKNGSSDYKREVAHAFHFLETHKHELLTGEQLATWSPKFAVMLENITRPSHRGLHLIYSQFRTMEGIGIFCLVLEANGFAHFKLRKTGGGSWAIDIKEEDLGKPTFALYTGTEDAEEREILRNIYNGTWDNVPNAIAEKLRRTSSNNNMGEIIKVLMITAAGSEGINLRNTRYVHAMEPYWHPVRVEQVIGRARRICSHQSLPPELQTVEVFIYIMIFTAKQLSSEYAIELKLKDLSKITEKPQTSDEKLLEISNIKENLTTQLLRGVKETAIDCLTHGKATAKEGLTCMTFSNPSTTAYTYNPNYTQDENDNMVAQNKKMVEWEAQELVLPDGRRYAYRPDNNYVYDYESYLQAKANPNMHPLLIGRLVRDGRRAYIVSER